jgi:hypothetical protein
MDKTDFFLIGGGIVSALVIGMFSKKTASAVSTVQQPDIKLDILPTTTKTIEKIGNFTRVTGAVNIGTLPPATSWKPVTPDAVPQYSTTELKTAIDSLKDKIIDKVIPAHMFIATPVEAAVLSAQTGTQINAGDRITPMTSDGSHVLVNVAVQSYTGNRR